MYKINLEKSGGRGVWAEAKTSREAWAVAMEQWEKTFGEGLDGLLFVRLEDTDENVTRTFRCDIVEITHDI